MLDIYVIKGVSLLTLARLIGKYAAGKADQFPRYITHLRGTEVEIDLDEEDVVNIDGGAARAKNIRMKLLPGAARLVVPRGMRFFEQDGDGENP